MKRFLLLVMLVVILFSSTLDSAMAKSNQMEDGVPYWTEETVRQYALDYIEGKSTSRLWGYYDLQIRRYMPEYSFETLLLDLEWLTGAFLELGSYKSFEEPENQLKTHVLHLCMEKQDLDMYFTHKNKEDDWEIMALEFVPAEEELLSNSQDMLVEIVNGPKASAGFSETEVVVGAAPYELKGILTLPVGASAQNPVPVCLLIHDEGALDHDSTLGKTAFFKVLAHELAELGIGSLRYDKRTYAYPDAVIETIQDEYLTDASAAAAFLKQEACVDQKRIVAVGHGFGATVVPRLVHASPEAFTAMILIGGTTKSWLDIEYQRNKETLAALPKEETDQIKSAVQRMKKWKADEAKAITLFGKNGFYYWDLLQTDPINLLKKLKMPLYVVQGMQDPIVSEDNGWKAYRTQVGPNATFAEYEGVRGLNHLLMDDLSTNAAGQPEYQVEANLDKQIVRKLAAWIERLYTE